MKSADLYEKCVVCDGTGVDQDAKDLVCPICQGEKYLPVGLNLGQVEMFRKAYEARQSNQATTTINFSGYLCPKEGCGLLMAKNGTITFEALTVGTSETKPMYSCPVHGGHFAVSGMFLTDIDAIPE